MKLKHYQRDQIREWFSPEPGYVLDFTNKTFSEFFDDHFEINIYSETFSERGTSKYNRLLSFIDVAPPHLTVQLLNLLWARRNSERDEQLRIASESLARGDWTVSQWAVDELWQAAENEDVPLKNLINELGALPSHSAAPHLEKISASWTLDTVEREMQRAFENIDRDPEASVTAACSMLESVCRSILFARNLELPARIDIKSLYRAVREPLGISPNKEIPDTEIEADVRTTLSAISNVVQGIGSLRTHAGTAHGRERGFRRIDPRIARLSVYSASAIALFLVETWEKEFPEDKLKVQPIPEG